jgi:pyrroloquinoline quinone biosynthesis protein E
MSNLRPLAVVAELTHRCPLSCPYCSNPLELCAPSQELDTRVWLEVIEQAAALGVLQLHLTGGEPLLRPDLEALAGKARAFGLYTNLITSGIPSAVGRIDSLAASGLDAVQVSFQDAARGSAKTIAGRDVFETKLEFCGAVKRAGMALTFNVVLHRNNLDRLSALLDLAEQLEAERIELAHVQYHGWASRNRSMLLPFPDQLRDAVTLVESAKQRLAGRIEIVHVLPDYFTRWPKRCMGGWGRQTLVIAPDGLALPCHSAKTLPGLAFDSVARRSLVEIWSSPSFEAFRGTDWMAEPCRSCSRRDQDFGGCRCQAFALTGDVRATDPACSLAPQHHLVLAARNEIDQQSRSPEYQYRTQRRLP